MKISKYIFIAVGAILFASCNDDPKKPGYEYMPDMYRAVSIEPNAMNPVYGDSMANRMPVAGTVARGNDMYTDYDRLPYPYTNDSAGYEGSGKELRNPLARTEANMAEGKRLYDNYCGMCHGGKGMGDGAVVLSGGPKPQAYNSDLLKNLPEGKMFHVTQFGKNNMGSYASQLTATQRWQIIAYVQTLQHPSVAGTATASDTTKKATASK